MPSCLVHTGDESVTLSAATVKRLLDRGDGDAALLYLALLRRQGTVPPRSLAGELRWDRGRIEAAETAGGAGRVWEIVGSGGSIRVLSGGSLSSRGVTQTEAGLRVGDASGGNDRAVPLSIYALKGDGVT